MRIGEFGKELEDHLSNGKIQVKAKDSDTRFNHYVITNFQDIYNAVNFIDEQHWLNNYIDPDLKQILSHFSITNKSVEVTGSDYKTIVKALEKLNERLGITLGLIRDFSPTQDEHTINVKLPDYIDTLEDLQSFNSRLEHIFKLFNISGDFKLSGFDKGSEWYEFIIHAPNLYKYFVGTLAVALSLVKIRKDFYDSELSKVHVELLKKREIEMSENEVTEELANIHAEKEAKNIVSTLGTVNNKTESEMEVMVLKAATELVKELEKGTEFHLSLNPPSYIKEEKSESTLKIDYSSIPPIESKPEPKELSEGSKKSKK